MYRGLILNTMHANNVVLMWWLFLVVLLVFTLVSTTDLHASGINATEIAKCMIAKSPYSGSFDRWDYADYCGGSDWWSMTSTERVEIQCQIDELTRMNYGNETDIDPLCECSTSDYYGGEMDDDDDLLQGPC